VVSEGLKGEWRDMALLIMLKEREPVALETEGAAMIRSVKGKLKCGKESCLEMKTQ